MCEEEGAHETYCLDWCSGYEGEVDVDGFKYRYYLVSLSPDTKASMPHIFEVHVTMGSSRSVSMMKARTMNDTIHRALSPSYTSRGAWNNVCSNHSVFAERIIHPQSTIIPSSASMYSVSQCLAIDV